MAFNWWQLFVFLFLEISRLAMQILVVKGLLLFVLGSGIIIFRSRVVNHMEINRLRISQSVRQGIKLRFMAQLKLRTKS
jgi:hypothetical protein